MCACVCVCVCVCLIHKLTLTFKCYSQKLTTTELRKLF